MAIKYAVLGTYGYAYLGTKTYTDFSNDTVGTNTIVASLYSCNAYNISKMFSTSTITAIVSISLTKAVIIKLSSCVLPTVYDTVTDNVLLSYVNAIVLAQNDVISEATVNTVFCLDTTIQLDTSLLADNYIVEYADSVVESGYDVTSDAVIYAPLYLDATTQSDISLIVDCCVVSYTNSIIGSACDITVNATVNTVFCLNTTIQADSSLITDNCVTKYTNSTIGSAYNIITDAVVRTVFYLGTTTTASTSLIADSCVTKYTDSTVDGIYGVLADSVNELYTTLNIDCDSQVYSDATILLSCSSIIDTQETINTDITVICYMGCSIETSFELHVTIGSIIELHAECSTYSDVLINYLSYDKLSGYSYDSLNKTSYATLALLGFIIVLNSTSDLSTNTNINADYVLIKRLTTTTDSNISVYAECKLVQTCTTNINFSIDLIADVNNKIQCSSNIKTDCDLRTLYMTYGVMAERKYLGLAELKYSDLQTYSFVLTFIQELQVNIDSKACIISDFILSEYLDVTMQSSAEVFAYCDNKTLIGATANFSFSVNAVPTVLWGRKKSRFYTTAVVVKKHYSKVVMG